MPASIRILALLAVVAALPFLPFPWPFYAVAALALVVLAVPADLRVGVLAAVARIRWLLLAVAILFLFFEPGPWTIDRALEALSRCAVLVCAVAAVRVALHGLTPEAMVDGLTRVMSPLRLAGLPTDAFASRLTLTLEAMPRVQALLAATPAPASGSPLERLAGRAAAVITAIERER